jgi:hypothetical protein
MTAQGQHRPDAAASALRQALAHRIDALDGYPVAALIAAWPDYASGVNAVLRQVLRRWICRLDDDLELIRSDDSPALADIKRRMLETRGAMEQLLDLVRPLDEGTVSGPGHRQLSAQTPSGSAGSIQLH